MPRRSNICTASNGKLADSEARNRTLLDAMPDTMLRMSRDGMILDFRAHRDTDVTVWPAETIGSAISQSPLAHESRNAFQRSQACLEMLTLEVEDRPEALESVERIQKAQNHLHYLYEEVRTYAAPIHLQHQTCDLAQVPGHALR